MRDLITELKQLRLHGMAAAWGELLEQGNVEEPTARWLLEQLLAAESREYRSGPALGQPTDERREVPGASRGGLRLRWLSG